MSVRDTFKLLINTYDNDNDNDNHYNYYTYNTILFIIFVGYLAQLLYHAIKLRYLGIIPDEVEHYAHIQLYINNLTLFLQDGPQTYPFGPVRTTPFLYYYLMGGCLKLNSLINLNPILFLRIINVIIAIIKFHYIYLLTKEIVSSKIIQLTIMMVATNILMYVALSAGITYDNLVNCLAVCSFYYLLRFLKGESGERLFNLAIFILLSLIGNLTKVTYPPLFLMQLILLLPFYKTMPQKVPPRKVPADLFRPKWLLTISSLVFFLVLNCTLYGRNLILYGSLEPSCPQVINEKICSNYSSSYVRDADLQKNVNLNPHKLPITLNFWNFFAKYVEENLGSILAIHTYQSIFKHYKDLYKENTLMILALLMLFLVNFKRCFYNYSFNVLFFSALAYLLLLFTHNYLTYQKFHVFGIALQGRYTFPVIINIVIVLTYGGMTGLHRYLKWPLFLFVSYVFIRGNFYYFKKFADSLWFN
ncbi:MAG: glycosyltransferase family 39 protein [Oligoflexia bacterium]|nr:glycosyltransferase family 39 protein [Oligoflexia bacterium]